MTKRYLTAFWSLLGAFFFVSSSWLLAAPVSPYPATTDVQRAKAPNLFAYQANSRVFEITFQDGGTNVNVTGRGPQMAWFTDAFATAQVLASSNITDAANGVVEFTFSESDLNTNGNYRYEVSLDDGSFVTIKQGRFRIFPSPPAAGVAALAMQDTYYRVTGDTLEGNMNLDSNSITNGLFVGDGSGLTNLTGASVTPWTENIDAAGYNLTDVGTIQFADMSNGIYRVDGAGKTYVTTHSSDSDTVRGTDLHTVVETDAGAGDVIFLMGETYQLGSGVNLVIPDNVSVRGIGRETLILGDEPNTSGSMMAMGDNTYLGFLSISNANAAGNAMGNGLSAARQFSENVVMESLTVGGVHQGAFFADEEHNSGTVIDCIFYGSEDTWKSGDDSRWVIHRSSFFNSGAASEVSAILFADRGTTTCYNCYLEGDQTNSQPLIGGVVLDGELNFYGGQIRITDDGGGVWPLFVSGGGTGTINATGMVISPDTNNAPGSGTINYLGTEFVNGLHAAGSVGIGTAAPASALHIGNTDYVDVTDGLSFGDGDSGFFEDIDDLINLSVGGSLYGFAAGYFRKEGTVTWSLMNESPSAVNPVYAFYIDTNTGIGSAGADQLSLITGGTEALRIDASQNVGIGTATPGEVLEVAGDAYIQTDLELGHATDTTLSRSAAGVLAVEGLPMQEQFHGFFLVRQTADLSMLDNTFYAFTGTSGGGGYEDYDTDNVYGMAGGGPDDHIVWGKTGVFHIDGVVEVGGISNSKKLHVWVHKNGGQYLKILEWPHHMTSANEGLPLRFIGYNDSATNTWHMEFKHEEGGTLTANGATTNRCWLTGYIMPD